MSKGYEAPVEVRELEKLINDFTYRNGFDVRDVFRDLLRYIIHGFSLPDTPPLSDWRYTKEQSKIFYDLYVTWIQIMQKQINRHGWYDAFGDLFMALTSQRGQQQKGQFFTPIHITELMSKMITGKKETTTEIPTLYDPAAGSGRTLLAAKADRPQSYLVAWDIDYTCCLMCVCNFLMNSCVGEVVCIDTLRMDNFRGAWLINAAYYRTGLPSIQWMNEQEYLLYKQADIPAYVFFLNQEKYDWHFRMRKIWAEFMTLFNDSPKDHSKPRTDMVPEDVEQSIQDNKNDQT
jgi:type I restriction enzyme M protein|nr:MAG TPA: type I restriction system adenine methylase [Bacteriophage sp.]